jgi:hypothetical protein
MIALAKRAEKSFPRVTVVTLGGGIIADAFVLLMIIACAYLALRQIAPPAARTADYSPTDFSAGRAMEHLKTIAQKPHPLGSPEEAEVRNYILRELTSMGLQTEEQRTKVVVNILGKLKGTGSGKTILLVGHYDTVPVSPGAADNGLAVAGLLETFRALKAGPPLSNDVTLLLTDGEEEGLLGAKAFVYDQTLSRDIGLVLNFDARGTQGPELMFETSEPNEWLIEGFAKAAPQPVANSLMGDIYKLLPNDTDFSIFKGAGYAGLNFACIDGFRYYHTSQDNLDHVSPDTLQHQGSSALALTRYFGNLKLEGNWEGSAVYFNLPGVPLVHYSRRWVAPFAGFAIAVFALVAALGLARGRLTLPGIFSGFLAVLLGMISTGVVITIVWWLINLLDSRTVAMSPGDSSQGQLYLLSLVAVTVGVVSASYRWLWRNISVEDLLAGGLIWWLLLTVLTSLFLAGGSYMFTWPLVLSLVGLVTLLGSKKQEPLSPIYLAVLLVCSLPSIFLVAPMVYLLLAGLTFKASAAVMMLAVLQLGLFLPYVNRWADAKKWLLPGASALAGFILVLAARLSV